MSERKNTTMCRVCPRHCRLTEGQVGFCGGRVAKGGEVLCRNYGQVTSMALDPIEKKPLARFQPGKKILSVGSYGCNMRCEFCQNHAISQLGTVSEDRRLERYYEKMPPEKLVQRAQELKKENNIGVAYTYNEPGIGYEYVLDTGKLVHKAGMVNVMVTNGYISADVLTHLLPVVDAFNIDLKCFTKEGYERLGGSLSAVRRSIWQVAGASHLEVTTLVVPGLSDSEEEMEQQARWLATVSPQIPLHISRYFPGWKASMPPTPTDKMERLFGIAKEHLQDVYLGNM